MQSNIQMAGDFTRGMTAVLPAIAGMFNSNGAYFRLQLRGFSTAMAHFLLAIAGFCAGNCRYFGLRLRVFFLPIACIFVCKSR